MPISEKQRENLESLILKLERCTGYKALTRESLLTLAALIYTLDSQRDLPPASLRALNRNPKGLFSEDLSQERNLLRAAEVFAEKGRKLLQNALER